MDEKLLQMARESGAKETQTYAFYKDSGTRVLSFTESALARFAELVLSGQRTVAWYLKEMYSLPGNSGVRERVVFGEAMPDGNGWVALCTRVKQEKV